MHTLFTAQKVCMIQRATIFVLFAFALTGCGGGGGSFSSSSIEDQVIALHANVDAGQIVEESFISKLATLIG